MMSTQTLPDIYEDLCKARLASDRMPTDEELKYAYDAVSAVWEFVFNPLVNGISVAAEARRDFFEDETVGRLLVFVDRCRDMLEHLEEEVLNVAVLAYGTDADGSPLTEHGARREGRQVEKYLSRLGANG